MRGCCRFRPVRPRGRGLPDRAGSVARWRACGSGAPSPAGFGVFALATGSLSSLGFLKHTRARPPGFVFRDTCGIRSWRPETCAFGIPLLFSKVSFMGPRYGPLLPFNGSKVWALEFYRACKGYIRGPLLGAHKTM